MSKVILLFCKSHWCVMFVLNSLGELVLGKCASLSVSISHCAWQLQLHVLFLYVCYACFIKVLMLYL